MDEFDALWLRLTPGEAEGPPPEPAPKSAVERAYAAAATYACFARACRRRSSALLFRDLAERKRALARRLAAEQYLRSGHWERPTGALYGRPTAQALRGLYLHERETAALAAAESEEQELALLAADCLRGLLESAMP